LQPSKKHLPVVRFVKPEEFKYWEKASKEYGFVYSASGALVRSSYKAGEFFVENMLKKSRKKIITRVDKIKGEENGL
jgi:lipoic acid synthetase